MAFSRLSHLECSREGTRYDADVVQNLSDVGAPLLARYDLDLVRDTVFPDEIAQRPPTLWRYHELLPVRDERNVITLGEGMTPLVPTPTAGRRLGMPNLLMKDEGLIPTGSFKARGAAVGVSRAHELGVTGVAMPTNGNAGAAWATYAARAGMKSLIAMPVDAPEITRRECIVSGAELYQVDGLIGDAGAMSFLVVGIVYGVMAGTITKARDVPDMMADALMDMRGFIVIAFAAGQFLEMFDWSGVGSWLATQGSDGLRSADLDGFPALLLALVISALLSLVIFSGASLWTILAPVFVPVFVGLGLHPAVIQATYRVGDSISHLISPLNPYVYVLEASAKRYDKTFTLGAIFARMALFVLPVLVLWTGILAVFYFGDIPVGPGTTIHLGGTA